MSDSTEFRALAKRLGNPLIAETGAARAEVILQSGDRDRAVAADHESARASLDKKLRAARAARPTDES